MKRAFQFCLLSIVAIAFFGCDPEKLIVWSPDGKTAAIVGGDGLYLSDANGRLSEMLLPNVQFVAWMPDSKRIIAEVRVEHVTWRDAEPHLADDQKKRIISIAQSIFVQANAFNGSLEQFVRSLGDNDPTRDESLATPIFLYLQDRYGKAMNEKFGQDWKDAANSSSHMLLLRLYDISTGLPQPGPILAHRFTSVAEIRPAPSGAAIAFVSGRNTTDPYDLFVVPADASRPPLKVAEQISRYPDWSADGRYLVYAQANPPKAEHMSTTRLGSLKWLEVAEQDGRLRKEIPIDEEHQTTNPNGGTTVATSPAKTLAALVYSNSSRVRCLKNGRILFSSLELHLPAAPADQSARPSLFAIDPAQQPTIVRMISKNTEAEIAEGVNYFEPSPDETRISIPGENGHLVVLHLPTGAVEVVLPKEGQQASRLMPTWRNNDELCFAIPNTQPLAKQRPAEIFLWSSGKEKRPVSDDWPDTALQKLGPDAAPTPHPPQPGQNDKQ